MTPQVRETETTPIAVPSTPLQATPVNVIKTAKPVASIKAPAPAEIEDTGPSMLD
eukprot:CAMPEP_0182937956 /NCGR_PEP_ID=MMETSP0105_2-20130417/43018_1 /TAXON_ID=81532 ORGANISM="Acanthoeca-like sp., Strain 10tr" /NCGR_SAMPLE_ID=MMETSP0105_2 /ASSEMBLY_ACC=CAM_ASM_000205 /LENGTH=54 /DNA_ID=CAMNT_0025077209 /DNA_START=19 /DNA_END=180 /DNA_ORIENTATION=-